MMIVVVIVIDKIQKLFECKLIFFF